MGISSRSRVEAEGFERKVIEQALVRGFEDERCDHARLMGLDPSCGTNTPLVAGLQAREPELGSRSAEIISDRFLELEKLAGHAHTGGVFARILAIGLTTAIPEITGQGIARAGAKGGSEYIFLERHG
jgi:hypothetical protein